MSLFDTGIRPAISEYLKTQQDKVRDYGDYWSASSAGYCMRKNIFERLKVPHVSKDDDERKTRVFESGHIFHEWMQRITKKSGLSIAQELELQDETLMIRGHIDDLVLVDEKPEYLMDMIDPKTATKPKARKHLILYDYKTAHSRSFHYAKDRPMSRYHRYQLGTYMYMLRSKKLVFKNPKERYEFPEGFLTEARRMSISKDDLCMAEAQLMWSPELESEILTYWQDLNRYWKEKKIPPCTCADYEGGFMANPKYNPYYRDGEPCSIKCYEEFKLKKEEVNV